MGILKNAKKAEQQHAPATPAFEAEEGNTVEVETTVKSVTREQVAPPAEVQAESPAAEVSADPVPAVEPTKSTAVLARAPGGQLKTFLNGGGGVISPLKDLEGAFQKAGIEIDYSTFPRMRVDAGCIASPEGAEAGDFLELQVVSYSPSWTITTGVDGEEGKKHVRFSDDGETINAAGDADEFAGFSLQDYKAHLISLGFEKSSVKEYCVIHGLALDAQEADFAHLNEMVSLSLSPQSKKKFDSYVINRSIQARMGRVQETSGNPVVRWTVERVKGKDVSYFNLVPSHGKTAPVDLA